MHTPPALPHRVHRRGLGACVLLCLMGCTAGRPDPSTTASRSTAVESPAPQLQEETLRPGLVAKQLAPETWVVTHVEAHSSNVLVARMPDGTVVIASSPFDADSTRVMLEWVRQRLAPERLVAINTHWHLDGTAGNAAYLEAGAEIHASTLTHALTLERGAAMRENAGYGLPPSVNERVRATPVVQATHTFAPSEGLTLTFGDEPVEVVFPGQAHSADNVVVLLPERGVLFGGCMLKLGDSLGYLGDASVERWGAALEPLEDMAPSIVIPGHGLPGGPEIIANTRRLVREALAETDRSPES